jgi:hypothetical protein
VGTKEQTFSKIVTILTNTVNENHRSEMQSPTSDGGGAIIALPGNAKKYLNQK